jgi:hypothetical protein
MNNYKIEENIEKRISAAFDSVNLINNLITTSGELTEDKKSTIERNLKHLEIMLSKEKFSESLTTEQRESIDNIIQLSINYLEEND